MREEVDPDSSIFFIDEKNFPHAREHYNGRGRGAVLMAVSPSPVSWRGVRASKRSRPLRRAR
jgi:hypothetical protein